MKTKSRISCVGLNHRSFCRLAVISLLQNNLNQTPSSCSSDCELFYGYHGMPPTSVTLSHSSSSVWDNYLFIISSLSNYLCILYFNFANVHYVL